MDDPNRSVPQGLHRIPATITSILAITAAIGGAASPMSGYHDHRLLGNWLFSQAYWMACLSAILWQIVFTAEYIAKFQSISKDT